MRSSFSRETDSSAERRTVIVERVNGSFGFTLQSYGIHYRNEADVEIVTYVDYVDLNGHAFKAGLKSGDVIISINGQDVERANHSKLVSIIQSCPDRIRMVVAFENCVRKVELHMKYIRLHQVLDAKAREYQEVCSSERSFIARLNKTRGFGAVPGSYHTIHPSQVMLRRSEGNKHQQADNNHVSPAYSSKSMPRSIRPGDGSPPDGGQNVKRRSYFCIGRTADCCFYQPEEKSDNRIGDKPRPRSYHIPSCYNPAESPACDDEQQLIDHRHQPIHRKAYEDYGFDCSNPTFYSSVHRRQGAVPSGYRRPTLPASGQAANKSVEDLLMANQFQDRCQLTPSKSQAPKKSGGDLDSIALYNRPSHPLIEPTATKNSTLCHESYRPRPVTNRQPTATVRSPDDDGGFNELRPYRTLPSSICNSGANPRPPRQ